MSAKLIAGLLAACVVAVGGVVLYHGDCPFSGGTCSTSATCPTAACSLESTGACCSEDVASAPCCATKAISAKASCCAESAATSEPVAAAFGGAVAANTK